MKITNECNMELMSRYEDNHFDLAIVDPPYGILNKKTVINKTHKNGTRTTNKKHSPILWDKSPNADYFLELSRVSKNVVVFGANNFVNYLDPSSAWVVWDKLVSNEVHFASAELIYTDFSCSVKIVSMSPFDNLRGGKDRIHPTEKPVRLYEWILNNYAKEGDKILDTHLGSGSIAIACHNLKYDLTACELDKEYFEAAMKRIERHKQQLTMF
tara:strand:+ start:70 stop:708 length:639 start_codon:yes stop_codon:yes gene_type:complete